MRVLKTIFFSIVFLQTLIIISIPLIHMMNDSGWYYMSVHFVNTGEYLTESMYPSFDEPSQFYPFLGYSLFLFICDKIATLTGIGLAMLVKLAQFSMFIFSAILVQKIIKLITNKQSLAYIISILFLLYYPYFNFVNLVMSETYATFLLLLTVYLFVKTQKTEFSRMTAVSMFLLAGYIILVKPVFIPISLAITFLFFVMVLKKRKYLLLLTIMPIFVFPVSQSLFSNAYYGNHKILTSGLGWHMWNRVIFYDKLIPTSSEHVAELERIYEKHNKPASYLYFWNVSKDLSEFGYKETETQQICLNIALDGIAEYPFTYIVNTFKNCYVNFLMLNPVKKVFCSLNQYLAVIDHFSNERQHKPLTDELSQQTYYSSFFLNDQMISLNCLYASVMSSLIFLFHNTFIFVLYLLAMLHSIYSLVRNRFREDYSELLILLAAIAIIFGSNMAEYPTTRLMQPAVIFMMMLLGLKADELLANFRRSRSN